ncbi:MAG: N-formylglutamate amidohydrolase [Henriciella sp.]|nr:N-formylglutamate amidohydrolase [Henriciella sp.]
MQTAVDRSQTPLETLPAAFSIARGETVSAPVIFASPHSGKVYPRQMTDLLSVPLRDLERTEDAFVDELYADAPHQGMVLLHATFARAFVDLNRDARELDASMFSDGVPRVAGMPSARVKAGLGCLPRVGASGRDIYAQQISRADGQFRLETVHDRYHAALQSEIDALKQDWADVFVIDCHSMPSRQPGRSNLPDIVLGDRFGSSCSAKLTSKVERFFRREGLSVTRNAPYAGGYTTRRYGRPRRGVHVLQIELNRALYMNEADVEKSNQFPHLQEKVSRLIVDIVDLAIAENS